MKGARSGAFLLALFALLGGCQSNPDRSPAGPDSADDLVVSWRELPDGSFFGRDRWDQPVNHLAMRCWPEQPNDYLCLQVGLGPMDMMEIAQSHESELKSVLLPLVEGHDGYRCRYLMGPQEEIVKGEVLVSNRLSRNSRWSGSYVRNYMAANGVGGSQWFRCLEILDVINRGSLETLSTTSITRDMVD